MVRHLLLVLCLACSVQSPALAQQQEPGVLPEFKYKTGKVPLGGVATLDLPPTLRFLDAAQTTFVVEQVWGNPPGGSFMGMVLPADKTPLDSDCMSAIISYEKSGYVSDKDAASIDYDALLKQMQAAEKEENAERTKQGFPPTHLVRWAKTPHYDATTKKLYWAKEINFGEPENMLNYCIRILGRQGVLEFNFVGTMDQLAQADRMSPEVMQAVQFDPGNRYADFNPSSDKVAAYGIAALVAGGVAAKAGLLKGLIIAILAAKKFIIIGGVALFAFLGRLFMRRG